ncbi:MAG: SRPBCC family protein [Deltaproteobacteria bacterium]|nr:SRPBCC family protein [Deltaproteobacteria bacterium]
MGTFAERVTINAPKDVVWNVLADIGSIHQWNPGVVDSRATTDGEVGLGSARRCELGGKNYLDEEVVEWVPKKILTMRIVATNLPFKTADIGFALESRGEQTLVTVSPTYRLKFGLLGTLLDAVLVRSQYRKGMINLLRGLKQHLESRYAG